MKHPYDAARWYLGYSPLVGPAFTPEQLELFRLTREAEVEALIRRAKLLPAQPAEAVSRATRPDILGWPVYMVKTTDPLPPDEIIRRVQAVAAEGGYTLRLEMTPRPKAGLLTRLFRKVGIPCLKRKSNK